MQLLMNSSCKSFVKFSVPLFSRIQSVQTSTSIISLEELFILTNISSVSTFYQPALFLWLTVKQIILTCVRNISQVSWCQQYCPSDWRRLKFYDSFSLVLLSPVSHWPQLRVKIVSSEIWEMNRLLTINYNKVTYFESKAWNYSGQENDGFLHKS